MFHKPKDLTKDPMDVFVVQENQLVLIDGFLFRVEYPSQTGEWKDHVYFTQVDPEGKNVERASTDESDYECVHVRLYKPSDKKHGNAIVSRLDWSDALNNRQNNRPCWEQFLSYEIR
jgi:hypothetical protein